MGEFNYHFCLSPLPRRSQDTGERFSMGAWLVCAGRRLRRKAGPFALETRWGKGLGVGAELP